ncbi:MAG: helix-turn-helix transcriptional regulator [Sphingomonadaceae bacterium]
MGRRPPITNRVRLHRMLAGGLTQAELADAVGVTRHTIIAIEQGHYSPSLETAFRIARFFNVGLETLFSWEGAEAPEAGSTPKEG